MNLSDATKTEAEAIIDELVNAIGDIRAAVISTEDGFELVSRARDDAQASRLSAMASSMAALGVMAGEECEIGGFRSITLEADAGFILMLQSTHPETNLILSVIADSQALVGKVLLYGKKSVARLANA